MNTPERRGALLFVATVTGLAAVLAGNTGLLLWSVALALVTGAVSAWSNVAWWGVEVVARFRPGRAFIGEPVTMEVRISNRKPLPLPLVRLRIWLPPGLASAEGSRSTTVRGYQRQLTVPGRSEALLILPVMVRRRGEYWLERIDVEITDPFDLAPFRREIVPPADLLVLPEPRIAVPVGVTRRLPFGLPANAARMFEARERFAGVRPYEPGDPLNRIHWKLTGHAGILQTKLFEPTRTAEVLLVLDLSVGEPFWDSVYPEVAEDTIGWASFLARLAIGSGWRVGLAANTHFTRGRGPLRVPASSAPGHEASLFASLARMPNEPTSDLAPVLREVSRQVAKETTAVVLSPRPGLWLQHEMASLRRRCAEVLHLTPLKAAR